MANPPKPTGLKVLQGTDKQHPERVNHDEPKPVAGDLVRPSWVLPRARKHWDRFLYSIQSMNVGQPVDAEGLATLCNALQEYLDASKDVQKYGITLREERRDRDGGLSIIVKSNPAVMARSDAWRRMNTMMQQFGLTPSSRAKLKVEKAEEVDELEELMRRKG
jgi:P27 family predicted phage terminase small subunit